jgi:UDP:flavonoid glycosyltransferase YjiC (YdhE family)
MARIVLSSHGTVGDFVPFVPLAKGLKGRGHSVLVAVNEAMQPLFRNAGLDVAACGPRFGAEEAQRFAPAFDGWNPLPNRHQLDEQINDVPANCEGLLAACRGADLLVAVSIQYAAPLVSAVLDLPWVCVYCNAAPFPHEPGDPLPPLPPADLHLLASSPHFSRPRATWKEDGPSPRLTGFWHYAGEDQPGWTDPAAELRAFVEGGDGDEDGSSAAPLALLPGSIPVADPRHVVAVHAEAAGLLGRRLVVQEGWARLGQEHLPAALDPARVHFARALPHDWLLERSAAVITHGTMGIVSKALRAACPILVEPYGRDLFFTARRVKALGLGTAMNPHQLTAEGVARALETRVLTAEVRHRAEALAAQVRAEDGVGRACCLVEEVLLRCRKRRNA